ncbi:MAG: carboxypeptidase regulatory-like domain-containing protein [Acidobacteriota bacterium]|nr:carboxypeptidase regulatory-like domain-containing protein [Acidobacteriota bacterium]
MVDEHGVPVEKAVVRVTPVGKALGYVLPWAETDAQGRFAIRKLDWGTWSTSASKPSEGYPDLPSVLYEKGGKLPMVVLSASSPAAEVEIQFAPKAGILTGRVSDSVTGAPIQADFEFRRHGSSRFEFGMGQPSNYRVFLPASETMDMKVSAPGYQTAYFPALNLSSGEEQKFDIELQPTPQ